MARPRAAVLEGWFPTHVDPLAPEPRRPRPVAGLPAVDSRAVAKSWLLELVAAASLDDAAALPLAELAREGPGLAAAVVAALSDDVALRRLQPGGNLDWLSARTAALAGAAGPGGAVRAAEALRRAAQAEIRAAGRIDALTAAELADRLAAVCALIAESAVAPGPPPPPVAAEPAAGAPEAAATEPPPAGEKHHPAPAGGRAEAAADGLTADLLRETDGEVVALRRDEGDARPDGLATDRDEGSWQSAVARRLERHAQDGTPFALLAVEVDGLERLRASQADDEVDVLLEAVERALAGEIRPADQLLRVQPGQYWVTAPDTGRAVARLLGERLAEAVSGVGVHRWVPLGVSVGVAVCPDDGTDADGLSAHADQSLFAARAQGTPVA